MTQPTFNKLRQSVIPYIGASKCNKEMGRIIKTWITAHHISTGSHNLALVTIRISIIFSQSLHVYRSIKTIVKTLQIQKMTKKIIKLILKISPRVPLSLRSIHCLLILSTNLQI